MDPSLPASADARPHGLGTDSSAASTASPARPIPALAPVSAQAPSSTSTSTSTVRLPSLQATLNLAPAAAAAVPASASASASVPASVPAQAPSTLSLWDAPKYNYDMVVRQQPSRGRMCGFSVVKDRRMMDPPLILQLVANDGPNTHKTGPAFGQHTMVHISLWSTDCKTDCSVVVNPRHKSQGSKLRELVEMTPGLNKLVTFDPEANRHCQTILGTTSATAVPLSDIDGSEGHFFIFPDLSVRIQGTYVIKCQLMELDLEGSMSFNVTKTIITQPFHMYPPKTFPRMLDSTDLSKCFARQGVPFHIRRDYSDVKEVEESKDGSNSSSSTGPSASRRHLVSTARHSSSQGTAPRAHPYAN